MKTKKLIAIGLSALMALSLAAPAFALGNPSSGTTTQPDSGNQDAGAGAGSDVSGSTGSASNYAIDIEGKYEDIPLSVVIIGTGKAVINPYALPYEVDLLTDEFEDDHGTKAVITGHGVTTLPMAVVNMSSAGLKVGATLTINAGGVELFAAKQTLADDDDKGIYGLKLQVITGATTADGLKEVDGLDISKEEDMNLLKDAITVVSAKEAAWAASSPGLNMVELAVDASKLENDGSGVFTAKPSASPLATLTKYDADTGVIATNVAPFRLTGDAPINPDEPWTEADTLSTSVAFSFAVSP